MRSSVCAAGIFLWTGSSRVMWSPASRFWMTVSSAAWPGKSSTCTPRSSTTSTVLQSSFLSLSLSLSLSEFCSVPYSTGTHHLELHCDCTVLQQHPSTLHAITQRVTTVSSDIWSAVSFQIQLSFFSDFSQLTLCWVLYCFVSASPLLLPLLPAPLLVQVLLLTKPVIITCSWHFCYCHCCYNLHSDLNLFYYCTTTNPKITTTANTIVTFITDSMFLCISSTTKYVHLLFFYL